MALVKKLGKAKPRDGKLHDEVPCATFVVFTESGPVIQIDTFGRATRKSESKVSQSIQLNRESAKALVELINRTFV